MLNTDFLKRAMAAYSKNDTDPQPTTDRSYVKTHVDRRYVVLSNATGTLAVYRIRSKGEIQRLTRWPDSLNEVALVIEAPRSSIDEVDVIEFAETHQLEKAIDEGVREGWITKDVAERLRNFRVTDTVDQGGACEP